MLSILYIVLIRHWSRSTLWGGGLWLLCQYISTSYQTFTRTRHSCTPLAANTVEPVFFPEKMNRSRDLTDIEISTHHCLNFGKAWAGGRTSFRRCGCNRRQLLLGFACPGIPGGKDLKKILRILTRSYADFWFS